MSQQDFRETLASLVDGPVPDDVELAHDPAEGSVRARIDASGNVEVAYVARDPFPPARFWPGDGTRGRLVPLRGKNRNEVESRFGLALPVRVTPDGVRLAMPTTTTLSSTHLYVPPAERAGGSLMAVIEWSERQLKAYDAWRKGETFGTVRETFAREEDDLVSLDVVADWSGLDLGQAMESVDARHLSHAPSAPSP